MPMDAIWWLIAAIGFLMLEAATFNLVSVWFAVGSAAALLSCLATDSLKIQAVVFIAVSAFCLVAFKPLAAKLRHTSTPTNGDRNIGRTAEVLTPVSPSATGRVHLDGVDWNARAVPGAEFQPGDTCRVAAMESTLLIVEPAMASSHADAT